MAEHCSGKKATLRSGGFFLSLIKPMLIFKDWLVYDVRNSAAKKAKISLKSYKTFQEVIQVESTNIL